MGFRQVRLFRINFAAVQEVSLIGSALRLDGVNETG